MLESTDHSAGQVPVENRRIRVFISSTFRDMMAERDSLMSHTWPELRSFCRKRQVELVEVDMRWGISEQQSNRKETLKLCLDEIRACRPYFIGLLGERYGWIPSDEAFTADLKEEQPWIVELHGKSVTELEILHGVLNNPDMAGRSFFYFRDPTYSKGRGPDFQAENDKAAKMQTDLKERIRKAHKASKIRLYENYPDPATLSELVLEHLKAVVDKQFPQEDIPDSLTREAQNHESFAEIRRRTYIGRDDYFKTLGHHIDSDGGPLVLLGESGSGKSALLANWLAHWRKKHPNDFIFQHYIGGTPDSTDHWQLMKRLMAEIKKWSDDPDELPTSHDDITRDFRLWLAKAHAKAQHDSVRCILIIDALNQLEDRDNSRLLGWLPPDTFTGPLRLIVSTLRGETMDAVKKYGWETLHIEELTEDQRRQMVVDYLKRFSKKQDPARIYRIIAAPATANPLYLKILLDELRITGTHEKLDERLDTYLSEPDIPSLLKNVLARYQRHYERDRKGLVKEALGLIFSARRGLSEIELWQLLRPTDLEQLPQAIWIPLRAAMEELLIDRSGILNFAHEFLRTAVQQVFVPGRENRDDFRLCLSCYFEELPASARSCDELPWLLWQRESMDLLRTCLLNIDRFLLIRSRDENELMGYWVWLKEERTMGKDYMESFDRWAHKCDTMNTHVANAASQIGSFLLHSALYAEAERLFRRALRIDENIFGKENPRVATNLINLAALLKDTNQMDKAEPLMRRALSILEKRFGKEHPNVATNLINLAGLFQDTNRMKEAEPLYLRALSIFEKSYGKEHPNVATALNNLAQLLCETNRMAEAEPLYRRALVIIEKNLGKEHPNVAKGHNNLAQLLCDTNRMAEAEPLYHKALSIHEKNFGKGHPEVATSLNNLAEFLRVTNRMDEAEPLYRRALRIDENVFGKEHPNVAIRLNNLALLLSATNRMAEAEPLLRRALKINEKSYGKEHPDISLALNNLAGLLQATNQMTEAEPLCRRALNISEKSLGKEHPQVAACLDNLARLLKATDRMTEAEPLLRRALKINEKSFGKEHPDVATALNSLAQLLQDTNRMAEAEPLYRRALNINEKSYGKKHPVVATALNNLAELLRATNRMSEAESLYQRALGIYESSLGKEHPHVATALNNLALLLQASNRTAEAEPVMRRALSIREKNLGKEHPDVASSLNLLAQLLYSTNRMSEAEQLYRRALSINEKCFGKKHPNVAACLNLLARLLYTTNRVDEAALHMHRAVRILITFSRSTGHPHPHLPAAVSTYTGLLQQMGYNRLQIMTKLRELDPDMFGG